MTMAGEALRMYWNKIEETIEREALEEIQLKRLKETVKRASSSAPFYSSQFDRMRLRPEDIKSLDDLRKLPFTTQEDLRATYPYGLLAIPKSEVIRLHTSSGTTSKPKAMFFSRKDIDQAAELIARCLVMSGITKDDVLQNMMTYGLFTGALIMHYGAEKVGLLVIPAGPGNSEKQLLLMQDFGSTAFHTTPSYALYFADYLEKKGIDPRKDLALRKAFIGAEPYSEETRRKIEDIYGVDVYNSYGLSEMNGPGVAFECEEKNGMHLWEDNYILEIVDPVTGDPMPDGQPGEMILTTLCREAMPILRYRTRDITSIITSKCACGRTHRRINRITGRTDDMFVLRGVNVYPQQIEGVLMGIPSVGRNYQIFLENLDDIIVKVELSAEVFDGRVDHLVHLQSEIQERLRHEILVKPVVDLVPPGTLPGFEGKGIRVIDKRAL